MDIIRQFKVVIMILVPILILVIIRSAGTNHFRPDTKNLAEPSVMKSNLLTNAEMAVLSGKILLINMDEAKADIPEIGSVTEVINITPDAILEKDNYKKISGQKGSVILFSSDAAVTSRIWIFLNQMGIENLYILTNDKDNESFKNKFRPDTLTRPEL